jgi:hypothetical protein
LSHVDPDPTVGSVQRKFTFRTVSDAGSALENILQLGNTSAAEISPLRWVTKTSFTTALDCYGDNQQHSGAVSAAGGTNPLTAQPLAVATVDTDRVSSTSYGSLVKIAGSAQRKTVARLLGPAACEWYFSAVRQRRLDAGFVRPAPPHGEMTEARLDRVKVFDCIIAAPNAHDVEAAWQYRILHEVEHYEGLVYPTINFIDSFSGPVGKTFVGWSARLVAAKIDAALHYKYMLEAFNNVTLRERISVLFVDCARRSSVPASVSDGKLKQICDSFVRPYFYTIALDLANRRMAKLVEEVVQPVIGRTLQQLAPAARARQHADSIAKKTKRYSKNSSKSASKKAKK